MRRLVPRHLTYANVAATLALVFSMAGGAFAASHYLINSTHQINPKVLRQLKGRTGKTGARGTLGPEGPQGPLGLQGNRGVAGHEGPEGLSDLKSLPSTDSESGVYDIQPDNSATSGKIAEAIGFSLGVDGEIHAEYIPVGGTDTTHCAGPGQAARGYLCVYSTESAGVELTPAVLNPATGTAGVGHRGFMLQWTVTAAEAFDFGTYTVTAP
ncbi:MAG TPA: hypothetical protein VGG08_08330 [Solirubrobacteraceae bacterium]